MAENTRSKIKGISILMETEDYSVISINLAEGASIKLYFANNNKNKNQSHSILLDGVEQQWTGPYFIQTN